MPAFACPPLHLSDAPRSPSARPPFPRLAIVLAGALAPWFLLVTVWQDTAGRAAFCLAPALPL